jgi:hypothetical protein
VGLLAVLVPFAVLAGIVVPVLVGRRRGALAPGTTWLRRLPWELPSLLVFAALFGVAATRG